MEVDEIGKAVKEEVARLEALHAVWMARVGEGDVVATEQVLLIQRQRAALLGIPMGVGARGVSLAAKGGGSDKEGSGPHEVRVTVEFVDDWRNA